MPRTLRLILGDQLTHSLQIIKDADKDNDVFLLAEVREEVAHIKHHIKKVAFIFSAMRHFADELEKHGYNVRYTKIGDPKNTNCLLGEITRAIFETKFEQVCVTEPSEYRLREEFLAWQQRLALPVSIFPDNRFLCTNEQFQTWMESDKELTMEHFYRKMRKQHNVLMENEKPIGNTWRHNTEKRLLSGFPSTTPRPIQHSPDGITRQVMRDVKLHFSTHFGEPEPFHFAVCAAQAKWALDDFIENRMAFFSDHKITLTQNAPWMFHDYLSVYLNCGLLRPIEVITAAEKAYKKNIAPLHAVEGFIRQILGWREYVRGIYWSNMPYYAFTNDLNAQRKLPEFYRTAQTKMNCIKQSVEATQKYAYAHHNQRLMILGNFALLAEINPTEVNQWFWVAYADAYEWVMRPNVTGTALYADGGKFASKPCATSGTEINKTSNYCQHCQYNVKKEQGSDACPFNYLYWHFLIKNKDYLHTNPELAPPYQTLQKMSNEKQHIIVQDAETFLEKMEKAESDNG